MKEYTTHHLDNWLDNWGQSDAELADAVNEGDLDPELFIALGYTYLFKYDLWVANNNQLYGEEDTTILNYLIEENREIIKEKFGKTV